MKIRSALVVPVALAALLAPSVTAAASPAPVAGGGDLVLGIGKSKGKVSLGASILIGDASLYRSRRGDDHRPKYGSKYGSKYSKKHGHDHHAHPSHGHHVSIGIYSPAPRAIWIPARTEVVHDRVYVPGAERRIWSPPRYETRVDSCGRVITVLASPGHWQTIHEPGHYELVARTVHHPGHWGTRY